ncbi:MAG TPA: sigma-70 family RNA polymerase sigma factor [Acidimicrobiales bacterium]|jgi:RNA polymerase sigma-70 factor (ECF subfamily)|nr:sigma-70 family RNA polymerase sigma factor [Acidimicrobiales bacterium]
MDAASRDRRSHRRRIDPAEASDEAPDEALVAGMAAGDEQAGAAFVQRHQRRVFGIALAITMDRSTAEDVAQEALLRAWRHAAVFDPRRGPVVPWLSTITRNLAIDALRVRRAAPAGPQDAVWLQLGDQVAPPEAPDALAVRADDMDRVRVALRAVPVEQQRALVRSAFYGQSASEIAAAENIALGTAKSRVRLGLARVRDLLGREE